jgi:hypothetical protein
MTLKDDLSFLKVTKSLKNSFHRDAVPLPQRWRLRRALIKAECYSFHHQRWSPSLKREA